MQNNHVKYLCCPKCRVDLEYIEREEQEHEQVVLRCVSGEHTYPVINGIPRFVDLENYAASFGFQWNKFSKVQLDSYNKSGFSQERFRTITEWKEQDLKDKLVLDAGCGAGRFAEVVISKYQSNLVAFDLSSAVEACYANLREYSPLICQASIYDLPFKDSIFDFVYCIGVIQHTPDPFKAIRALCKLVKPGGQIGLWIYELNWKCFVGTAGFKYALRPIISQFPRNVQVGFCKFLVNICYPIIAISKQLALPGKIIMRLLPVASAHLQFANLSLADFKTWLFLDTFDMYTPAYDKPQQFSVIVRLLEEEGFENIQRHPHGAISVTATRRV